ncbi:MAG: DNA polymerase I [Bacillota bacterium]
MTPSTREKFVIIDGNSLLYRAFFALPLLQNRRGEHTNAIYGFTNMLFKLLEEEKPDYVAVAFDPPRPTFRSRIEPSYKAQREKAPPELNEQILRSRQLLEAMGITVFEVDDYEADDVIGTIAGRFAGDGREVTVVTGDADLLQVIGDQVNVMMTKKGITRMERYDYSRLKEEYGFEPPQIVDYKALKGDASDNIPGVPGIGEKTARKLIEEYHNLETIYDNLDQLKKKIAKNLQEYREQLDTGRRLVTIDNQVPLDFAWAECRFQEPDYDKLMPLLNELEFKSLINRLKDRLSESGYGEVEETGEKAVGELVNELGQFNKILDSLEESDNLALLLEHEKGRPYWKQPVFILALATGEDKCFYLKPPSFGKQEAEIWKSLAAAGEKGVELVVHQPKQWFHLFEEEGLASPCIAFDSELAAYLADPARGGYELPQLMQWYLGLDLDYSGGTKKEQAAFEDKGPQLAWQAGHLISLKESLEEELKDQELISLLYDLELPLTGVLARMERRGITIDTGYLRDLSAEIRSRLDELANKIYSLAGEEFNLNSPQQLSRVLFDKLKLPEIRKTKTGRSTDARVLEELAPQHEIAALLLHYRQLAKLEGTYLSGLIELIDQQEQKLYTQFNQTATATGRLSSSDPNLQNIPIRLEEGRRIRRAFIPSSKEKIFFAADYSQVELRILAHLSGDPILVEAFKTGEDIHRRTAAEVNHTTLQEVTPLMREKAKAVNFGIIYGSSDYGLAQNLKIPRSEAKAYIDSYFERYQGVKEYMDKIIARAREKGYVTTMFNRRRYLPEINSSNHNTRSFAERMALNTPIQGSAADIIKQAMLRIDSMITEGGFSAALLLQIHDELLFEIEESELNIFAPMVRREMEQAFELSVPLEVDLKWGYSWEELKEME